MGYIASYAQGTQLCISIVYTQLQPKGIIDQFGWPLWVMANHDITRLTRVHLLLWNKDSQRPQLQIHMMLRIDHYYRPIFLTPLSTLPENSHIFLQNEGKRFSPHTASRKGLKEGSAVNIQNAEKKERTARWQQRLTVQYLFPVMTPFSFRSMRMRLFSFKIWCSLPGFKLSKI